MRFLWFILGLIVITIALTVGASLTSDCTKVLPLGTFVILSATLVALVVYACDTHTIAQVTKSDAEQRTPVRSAAYSMGMTGNPETKDRTMFSLTNPSTVIVRAKVQCNFRVYGQPVEYHNDFNGQNTWYVFPQQTSVGWFELSPLLAKVGKTCEQMAAERNTDNWNDQLTMYLEMEFRDELGNKRRLPSRRHFFNFELWRWVPLLTKRDDWEQLEEE